jgi:hypothetical protein
MFVNVMFTYLNLNLFQMQILHEEVEVVTHDISEEEMETGLCRESPVGPSQGPVA